MPDVTEVAPAGGVVLAPSNAVSGVVEDESPWAHLSRSGTTIFGGIITGDEYQKDLEGEAGLKIYDQMWRGDGQVNSVVRVYTLPIMHAEWAVKAASDDPFDTFVAQQIQDNLFGGLDVTWDHLLWQILTGMYVFGHEVREKVWAPPDPMDGLIRLRKFAPIKQTTIKKWYPDGDDGLLSIEQHAFFPEPPKPGDLTPSAGVHKRVIIPADKLCVFTLQQLGNNFLGISLIRQAYTHWYYKRHLMFLDAVRAERGQAVPVANAPEDVRADDLEAAEDVMAAYHAHEKAYIVLPHGWTVQMAGLGQTSTVNPQSSLDYHDLQIARSVHAQFLNLSGGGSQALSRDHSSFMLMSLGSVTQAVKSQFNTLIRAMVDMNWQVERYPTLEVSGLDTRDLDEHGGALANLAGAQLLTPTLETENALRKVQGLPEIDAEKWQAARQPVAAPGAPVAPGAVPAPGLPDEAMIPHEYEPAVVDTDSQGAAAEMTPEEAMRIEQEWAEAGMVPPPELPLADSRAMRDALWELREKMLPFVEVGA